MKARTLILLLLVITTFTCVDQLQAFYNPHQGRWLNRDSIGENAGSSLYAYVGNKPVSRVDRLGQLELKSIGEPSVDPKGTHWFAGVWFKFNADDSSKLNGQGTLVISKSIAYGIEPCNTTIITFWDEADMWFIKPFALDDMGKITGGHTTTVKGTGQEGLALDLTSVNVSSLIQGNPSGSYDYATAVNNHGGSTGSFTTILRWAVVPGNLSGGSTTALSVNYWGAYDNTAANAEHPPNAWGNWSQAIATGTLTARARWNQCICRPSKEMTVTSSWAVTNSGPDREGKRDQPGIDLQWEIE